MRETILFNCAEDAEACSEVVSFSQRREYDSRSSSLSITCAVASEEDFFGVCVCVCAKGRSRGRRNWCLGAAGAGRDEK